MVLFMRMQKRNRNKESRGKRAKPVLVGKSLISSESRAMKYARFLCLLAIASIVVFFVHLPVLKSQAHFIDDDQYLYENSLVQNPGWNSIRTFFVEVADPSTVRGYYQPLSMISLMLDYALGESVDDLKQFHQTSLLLHIANTILIIVLLYLLFDDLWLAFGLGMIFGLHPVTVEPIAWISDRKTLLASFFSFSCIVCYISYVRTRLWSFYVLCLLTFLFGLLSKPTIVCIPIILVLMDIWPLKRISKSVLLEKVPFFIVALILGVVSFVSQYAQSSKEPSLAKSVGLLDYPLIMCQNVVHYLQSLVLPTGRPIYSPFPDEISITIPQFMWSFIFAFIIVVILLFSLKKTRSLTIAFLIFLIALLPTIQFFKFTNVIVSDKYIYFPFFGILMLLASIGCRLKGLKVIGNIAFKRVIMIFVFILVLSLESVATRQCLNNWRDTVPLYHYLLRGSPEAVALHNNLASEFMKTDRVDEAIVHYNRSLELTHVDPDVLSNLGIALKAKGQVDEAIKYFNMAIELNPNKPEFYTNIGSVYHVSGKLSEAVRVYTKALELNPDMLQARINLGIALLKLKEGEQAIAHFERVLEIWPNHTEALVGIAQACVMLNRYEEATNKYQAVLKKKPDNAVLHYELANVYLKITKYALAQNHFASAYKNDSSLIAARIKQADMLMIMGEIRRGIDVYYQVLEVSQKQMGVLCKLSLILSVTEEEGFSNLTDARKFATRICQMTDYKHPGTLDILAVVLAASDDFEQAVSVAEKAIMIANESNQLDLSQKIENKLKLYRSGRKFKEPLAALEAMFL